MAATAPVSNIGRVSLGKLSLKSSKPNGQIKKKFTPYIEPLGRWRLFKGDYVQVISGNERGGKGIITKALHSENRVVVKDLNYSMRTRRLPNGKKVAYNKEAPMHVSNVMLIDKSKEQPTRIAIKYSDNGKRVRVSKKSGNMIPKNLNPRIVSRRPEKPTEFDTPLDIVQQKTYQPRNDYNSLTPVRFEKYIKKGGFITPTKDIVDMVWKYKSDQLALAKKNRKIHRDAQLGIIKSSESKIPEVKSL